MTRSGVRKSQEPCAVPVSVITGQHPDTRTHRHRDTDTETDLNQNVRVSMKVEKTTG